VQVVLDCSAVPTSATSLVIPARESAPRHRAGQGVLSMAVVNNPASPCTSQLAGVNSHHIVESPPSGFARP